MPLTIREFKRNLITISRGLDNSNIGKAVTALTQTEQRQIQGEEELRRELIQMISSFDPKKPLDGDLSPLQELYSRGDNNKLRKAAGYLLSRLDNSDDPNPLPIIECLHELYQLKEGLRENSLFGHREDPIRSLDGVVNITKVGDFRKKLEVLKQAGDFDPTTVYMHANSWTYQLISQISDPSQRSRALARYSDLKRVLDHLPHYCFLIPPSDEKNKMPESGETFPVSHQRFQVCLYVKNMEDPTYIDITQSTPNKGQQIQVYKDNPLSPLEEVTLPPEIKINLQDFRTVFEP